MNEDKICISCKVQEEMDRLMTTASLKPCLQTLSGLNDNFFEISFFFNARSLLKHYLDVKRYIQFYSPHVAFFAETRLSIFDLNEKFQIENYVLYRNDERVNHYQIPFHGSSIYSCLLGLSCCVLRQNTLLSQCFSSPRCTNGYQQICWG